ncbi:Uncharacterised protein [Neisseria gonorrhoeae]|uniref:Uncharacterized protein n=1 Tax=Neisseria gonorrhoeae TaxID=485 RepID=A0A378VXA3_NEIGO|nr:Uncharacterised protein [Neisseria gonorrhoeae]
MATEILGHTVGVTANELAIHSMEVMDKFQAARPTTRRYGLSADDLRTPNDGRDV